MTDAGLLWLSLRHVYSWREWSHRTQPHIITNKERLAALRAAEAADPIVGNAHPWQWTRPAFRGVTLQCDPTMPTGPWPSDEQCEAFGKALRRAK